MSDAIASMTGLKAMGFQLKGAAPSDSNQEVTKGRLNQYFYVDNVRAGIDSYPNNRLITYTELTNSTFALPAKPFYQYDVTRSSIPGATGAFFNYKGSDLASHQVLQNTYGYVGRFCMEDGSYTNNQYNVYTFTYVGPCYPNYSTYPQPYLVGSSLYFNNLGSYSVEDVIVYQAITVTGKTNNAGLYIGSASFVTDIVLAAVGTVAFPVGFVWAAVSVGLALYQPAPSTNVTNQVRYTMVGTYTNGTANISAIKFTGSGGLSDFYVAYKVKASGGGYPIVFGYSSGQAQPPGFTY